MIRTLLKEVRQYKAASIATPLFMILEVLMEMVIPFLMASIIDDGVNAGDIHDRVNYAVESSSLVIGPRRDSVTLCLTIDTSICAVMDYFEIFLTRMLLCRRAAEFLGLKFKLLINDITLL